MTAFTVGGDPTARQPLRPCDTARLSQELRPCHLLLYRTLLYGESAAAGRLEFILGTHRNQNDANSIWRGWPALAFGLALDDGDTSVCRRTQAIHHSAGPVNFNFRLGSCSQAEMDPQVALRAVAAAAADFIHQAAAAGG